MKVPREVWQGRGTELLDDLKVIGTMCLIFFC